MATNSFEIEIFLIKVKYDKKRGETMNKTDKQIQDNYFYIIYRSLLIDWSKEILKEMSLDDTTIGFGRFWYDIIPIEDKVNLAKAALQTINQVYLAKRKQDVNFNQKDPFDIALELIAMKDDASYKPSFLLSIQLICAEILGIIEGSCPILFTSKQEEQTPHTLVKVYENANYDFEFVNMSELEQARTILQITKMEVAKQQGPIPNVSYLILKNM